MAVIFETFTDTDGTVLSSHTGETGATWVLPITYDLGSKLYIYNNRVTKDNVATSVVYRASGIPNTSQVITAVFEVLSDVGMNFGVCFRGQINADSFYNIRYNQGAAAWEFRQTVNSEATAIASFAEALPAGSTRTVEITFVGNNFTIKINGTVRFSGTNSSLPNQGWVGLRASGAASPTTGIAVTLLQADNILAPNPPSNLQANVISATQINLLWTDNSDNEDSFRIERKTGVGGVYAEINSTGPNVNTLNDTTVSANQTYFYRVKARNSLGDSAYSPEISISTSSSGPSAPSFLVISSISARQTKLQWTINSSNETSFRIERKTGAGGAYTEIGSVGAGINTYTDNTTTALNTYFYRVKARNASGDSPYLQEQSITTPNTVTIWQANLQHGEGTDNIANYARQLAVLTSGSDIICVQERTTGDPSWDSGLAAAGFTQAVYLENDPSQGDGPAIWYRTSSVSIVQAWSHFLSQDAIGWRGVNVDKAAVAVKCTVGSKTFYVVCTHLAWSEGADAQGSHYSAIRVSQIQELLNWINATLTGGLDIIIIGDLNLGPDYPRAPEKTFTADAATNTITITNNTWVAGTAVAVRADTTLVGGLTTETPYYLRDVAGNTAKLAATPGGPVIDLTSAGTGTQYIVATQLDLFTQNYLDLWFEGLSNGKSTANWGDRDGNGVPDMPVTNLTTRTHDTRRIDYALLKKNATNLSLRGIDIPDLRAQCPHALSGFVCSPEVQNLSGTVDDAGVRPSDHNWFTVTLNIAAPTANFTLPSSAFTGEPVIGDGTSSTGVNDQLGWSTESFDDGTAPVAWDFGDNQGTYSKPDILRACHVYLKPGTYTVNLSVRDSNKNTSQAVPKSIIISDIPPAVGAAIRTAVEQGSPSANASHLQGLINTAFANNTTEQEIRIPNSMQITGVLNIPAATGDKYVTIRPVNLAGLPGPTARVTLANAANMPKISSGGVDQIQFQMNGAGRHHLRLIGLEFNKQPGHLWQFMEIGNGTTSYAEQPHHIIIDRCIFRGNPFDNTVRAIFTNGDSISIINCYMVDLHDDGADAQCVSGFAGSGIAIINNYLEGYGENVLFGGADSGIKFQATASSPTSTSCILSSITGLRIGDGISFTVGGIRGPWTNAIVRSIGPGNLIGFDQITNQSGTPTPPDTAANSVKYGASPQDILVAKNYIYKSLTFRTLDAQFNGVYGPVVKNTFELKHAFRAIVTCNVMENMWGGQGQSGPSVLFTPRNQTCYHDCIEQSNPWSTVRDVHLISNKIFNISDFVNILGTDNLNLSGTEESGPSGFVSYVRVANNLITTDANALNGGALMLFVFPGAKFITFAHNTQVDKGTGGGYIVGSTVNYVGTVTNKVRIVNNIMKHLQYGFIADGNQAGDAVAIYFPDGIFKYNVISDEKGTAVGLDWSSSRVNPTYIIPTIDTTTFINRAAGNYKLRTDSPFKAGNATPASDGKDMGVDVDVLDADTLHSVDGQWDMAGANLAPTVSAGPDQTLPLNATTVTLSGSASDPEGFAVSTIWTLVSGPNNPSITNSGALSTTVTGLIPGTYIFRLTATDNAGSQSSDTVQIIVPSNVPPTVNAGTDQNLASGTTSTTLTGTSTDPEGQATTKTWSRLSGPNNPTIVSPNSLSTSVTGMVNGVYVFRLTVSDGVNTVFDDVQVNISANVGPTVNAGADKNLPASTTSTTLSATASDPDGSIATVLWQKISGPGGGAIGSPTSLTTAITGLVPGVYTFKCSVTDNLGANASDDVIVRINSLPVISAGTDQNLPASTASTTLSGTASDADGDLLAVSWSRVSGPNVPTISFPASLTTGITGLIPGTYVFRLSVNDGVNPSVTDDVQVVVASNISPTVNAGSDQNLPAPTTQTTLTAVANDPDGSITSVSWSKVSGPAGGAIQSPTSFISLVTGLGIGIYTFRCTVTDNLGGSAFDDVIVRINSLPTVNAGPNQSIALPANAVTLTGTATDPDGDSLTKTWARISGPNTPSIVSPNSLSTAVTGLVAGTYIFRLTVNDGINADVSDDIQVSVAANLPPAVTAGPDQNLPQTTTQTTLNGASSDPESGAITKTWSQVSGPNSATITNPTNFVTTVTGLVPGTYVFRLTVDDGVNPSVTDDVTVKINRAPTVNAGSDQTLNPGTTETNLTGTIADADADALVKNWVRVSGPNFPVLSTPSLAATHVAGLITGEYIFRLSVSDGINPTVTDDIKVTVQQSPTSLDTIPNYWVWKTPIAAHKDVSTFTPYYGPEQSRGFGAGDPSHAWELGNDDSSHENYLTIKEFWDEHHPGVPFYLYDPQLDETRVYQIDSDFAGHYNHGDSYTWTFRIKEVYPYTKIVGPPPG